MKKLIATFLTIAMMAVVLPFAASAQTNSGKRFDRDADSRQRQQKDENFYDEHRNLLNIGIGAGLGALIGALVGGKKGALIGTAAGAGGAALYTYGINPKDKDDKRKNPRRNNRNNRRP